MIKINKSADIPKILTNLGVTARDKLISDYNNAPMNYTSRAGVSNKEITSLKFDRAIYADNSVKNNLIADQHEKCCFCEAKFLETSYGDVEHFRPKTAYLKLGERKLTYPGYYWLAYDWSNLLFSCEKCNRSYKKNQFPLSNESTRKPSHMHANLLADEERLLIDPTIEDPSDFFEFKGEEPVEIKGNPKGKKSIKAFNLERLNSARLEYIKILKTSLTFARIDKTDEEQLQLGVDFFEIPKEELIELIDAAVTLYNNAAKDTAKFSYCVRCNFPELPTV